MRRLTVAVLGLGCLALLIGTIAISLPTSANAQEPQGFRPDYEGCDAAQPDDLCKGDSKVMICHFNEGADFGKAHCQQEDGYPSHIDPAGIQGHGHKDFCIRSAEEISDCEKGIIPPK